VTHGLIAVGAVRSSLRGADGNVEFLFQVARVASDATLVSDDALDALVDVAVPA